MSLLHPDVLNSLRHPSMVPNPHQRPADEQGIPDYSSAPPTPQAPPGYFRETGLSVEKFMWFRGRDEKEKKHREAQRYGTSPATELAEVLAYRLTPDSPEEKTYVGVNRLFEKGFFLDPTLDIANKDHQKFLAVGLTIFEPGKIPTDFSFEDRALALHILNAYQDVYKSDKSAHPSEAPKDSLIDKRTLELFKTATGVNGRLGAIVQAVESWQAIGELTGIISKTDPIPITKSQFQRIFGNNYPPENIPALLNSGLTLETGLQQELTTKSIGYLQTQIAARPVNPPVEQPMPQLDPQDKAAVCSDLAHFLETAKVLEVAIPDEVQLEIAQRYEQALPTDQELAEHSKEVDTQLEKFQEELNTTRQVEIYRVARQVAQDLGYAVHGWCQRTKNVKDRKERLGQAKGDFLSFVDALGIKEISGYQNMSLRGIQALIEHQIIAAQAKGIDVLQAVRTAYENDVRMTRKAILRCKQLNGMLSGPHDDLKRLGEMIISHEKTVEKSFEKMAKGLRLINAMYDGIKIAGAITSVVPGGQVAGAALMAAGEVGAQATGLVDSYNNRGWDAQYGWAMNRLSSITRAEEMLFGANANLQNWNQVLLGRKHDQVEFLLKNPQLFRPQAYLRNLRDEVTDARKNLENIDSQINLTRAKETDYLQEIDRITPESGKSEQKMLSAQKKAQRDLNKKNIKELNRHTKTYSKFRTRLATLTAERLNNFQTGDVLSFQREEELQLLKALEARLAEHEKIAEMPDHHKKGAENMTTEELLRSSGKWLEKLHRECTSANREWKDSEYQALQSEMAQENYRKTVLAEQGRGLNHREIDQFSAVRKRNKLQIDEAKERYRANFQNIVNEKIFLAQIGRQSNIWSYRSHSSSDHPKLIPLLREESNKRVASLRLLVFTQKQTMVRAAQEQELKLRKSIASLKQYEGLNPLTDKLTPEQTSGHHQLGELKDELDAVKAFRREQEKVCRELDTAIDQEEIYRDVHLWEAIDHLPLNQRIPCAQQCRDNLFASYDASYAQKKSDLEVLNENEKEYQQKLNDIPLADRSDISLLEQNDAPLRRFLNEQSDRARAKRLVILSEMQAIVKAKLQETVSYCNLSHRVDMERWEQADNEGRKALLPAMQLSSNERHKLLTTAQEEASRSKELFQAAADEANTILYAAELRLRDDSSAEELEIQEAIDDARLKYVGLRKSRQDAAQAEEHLREKIAQNENALKRSYVEGYIAEMQSTLRWLQMKQRDSADQALYDELRHLVQAFEQDNALTHLGNCIEVFGWCAEIMRKTPFSTKERESYARLVFYCRTLSSVATLGVDIWGFHKLVQTRWSKNAGSSLSVIPNMDWVKLLIETGLAFGSASPADMALLLINSLKAAGMVVQSLKLWKDERHLIGPNLFERVDGFGRQMENFVERMDAQFLNMEKHLEAQMVALQSHQDQLTDELRADLKSLSHKIQVLSKLREDQIKQLVGKVEAGNLSTQQTLVTQEVAKFKASCSNAQSWLRNPERAKALWLSKYLENVKHFLSRAVDPDITGRNKPGTVDLSKIAASPHDYVGFLGNFVGLIVPSVPLFNAVAASLAQVGRAALQRALPIEDKKDIRDKVVLALSSANRIKNFTDLASTFLDKTAEALCNLSKYYSAVLQKAEDKRAEALSGILEQSVKGSQNTFLILTNEKSQRFALSTVLHDASFGPVFQDRLRDHLKAWEGQNHALQNIGLPALLLGVSIASPPLAVAYGGMIVALRLPEIGRFIYPSTDKRLGSREQEISQFMSTLRLGSEILPSEFNDKEDNLSIDFYSDETNSLEICESRLTYRCQSLCIKTHSDSRGISRNDRRKGLSSAPIVSATVRLFFSEGYPRVWKFEPDGLIQESDVKRIHKIGLSRMQGDHYKHSTAYNQRVRELFEAVEELVSKREKTPESNPLSAIAKTSAFIPPAARGMVPLAFPTALIERLTGQLREDLLFLHFVKHGTLVPYYEFKKNEFTKELTLSIVFRHRNNEGIDKDFCRFRDVLAIDRRTQGALEGVCSDANSPQTPVQASRMLLYIMYGGLVGLGMPGHESYSLQNSKGVAPVDLPFEGFYQKLIKDTQRGIHFHTGEFKTESSPEGWFTDIEMEPCYEGDLIMDAALEENFPELVEEMHKNPQFQAYEESYYQAMAHLAFTHSLKTNVLNGIDNEQIIEDAPALEDLGSLFADCGFPSPDATFESCRKMKTADPDARGLLGKLKSAYNLTVHHQTFIDNSNDLLFLLNSLNTEPTLSPEKSVSKVQQETGRSISSREPSYRTGMSVDVSAHQWYSQQRRDGVGEKRNQAKAAADAVKFKLKEGKQFSVDRQFYYIAVTTPDGACGLHALVGKKIDGRYTYPDSRKEFGLKLSHKIEEQFIRQLWRGWMLVSLKDYIGIRSYPYTEFVFGKIPNSIQTLQVALAELDREKDKLQKDQEALFDQLPQLDEFKDSKDLDREKRNNKIRENLNQIIEKQKGNDFGKALANNLASLAGVQSRREALLENVIDKKEAWEAYKEAIADSGYYLSTQELGLAAHLFEKRVVVYAESPLNPGKAELCFKAGNSDHPEIVIFHRGLHYSRCEEIVPPAE